MLIFFPQVSDLLSEIQELTTDAKEIRQNGHQQEEDSVFALSYILVMLEAARKCCGARPFSVSSSQSDSSSGFAKKKIQIQYRFFFFYYKIFFSQAILYFFFLFKFWSTALPRILLKCTGAYKLQILWFWIKTTVFSARIWVPKTPLFDPDIQNQKLLDLQHF